MHLTGPVALSLARVHLSCPTTRLTEGNWSRQNGVGNTSRQADSTRYIHCQITASLWLL